MKLTKEQSDIIYTDKKNIFIIARAGSGKTTTLIEFTKVRPHDIFLYLAYNTEIKENSKRKFFGNTEVHNIHSLAFKEIGKFYKHKITKNMKLIDIIFGVDYLKEEYFKDKSNFSTFIIANRVLSLLTMYFNSRIKEMDSFDSQDEILNYASEYFRKMQDLSNKDVKMTHDGYLKLYQLSEPILDYDYILVDEAQDSNEVMLDIVMNQKAFKIFVGDNYQSIYGFRNLVNVLDIKGIGERFYLTKSFRFGESISFVVNEFLSFYKNDFRPISGLGKDMICILDYSIPYTFITRTNAYLFDLAAQSTKQGKKIHILGGELVFNEMLDVMNLYLGKIFKIKSFYIRELKSFNNMKKVAAETNDPELKFLCKVVEKYKEDIANIIIRIKNCIVKERNADIVFTNVHKSKGLEFFNVRLANDFMPLFDKNKKLINKSLIDQEEINIYYVAMTRAIENLELNKQLNMFFEKKYDLL